MKLVLVALALLGGSILAQPPFNPQQGQRTQPPGRTSPPTDSSAPSSIMTELETKVSQHTITLHGKPIAYTAYAEQIPLRNDNGEIEVRMFCASYLQDGVDPRNRPVTFAFNGGPGSATLWLHMGALGPKRAPMPDDGSLPKPPYEPLLNEESWLDFSDLVLIDAPATGFSRLTKPDLGSKYFGVRQDITAFTDFIRNWLTKHQRWNSPLFVAGESYGGIRGSGLSYSLFRAGIALSGFVSISGTSNFMTLDGMRGNDVTYIGFLPSMAACAWYHHRLNPRFKSVDAVVKEAEAWIDQEYAAALQRGDSLSDKEKDHVAAKLSEYLGISKAYCLGANLRVSERMFFRELLRDQGLTIGRYDGRLVGKEELKVGDRGSGDPSDEATTPPFTAAINDYFEKDLMIKTDLRYLNSGNVNPWQEPEGSYSETATDLRNAIARNSHFHVLYCCGYYDLACPLYGSIYTVNHMGLDAESRSRVEFAYYPAGHMMYIEKSSRQKLHDDVMRFEAECLSGK